MTGEVKILLLGYITLTKGCNDDVKEYRKILGSMQSPDGIIANVPCAVHVDFANNYPAETVWGCMINPQL